MVSFAFLPLINPSQSISKRSAKKKKKLAHQGEHRIRVYQACANNGFNT